MRAKRRIWTIGGINIYTAKRIAQFVFREYFFRIEEDYVNLIFNIYLHKSLGGVNINEDVVNDFKNFPYWKSTYNVNIINFENNEDYFPKLKRKLSRRKQNNKLLTLDGMKVNVLKEICKFYFGSFFFDCTLNERLKRFDIKLFSEMKGRKINEDLIKDFVEYFGSSKYYISKVNTEFETT